MLAKYQDTVIASFAGHTHADDFRLINAAGANKLFVLINPAISPIQVHSQTPGQSDKAA